jgi:hypothetical protein
MKLFNNIKPFKWEDLDGKTLQIIVFKTADGISVAGIENNEIYLLYQNIIPENKGCGK